MAKVIAVRWLHAYRGLSRPLREVALESLAGEREFAFAYQAPAVQVGNAKIGLLLDLDNSRLSGRAVGDAWTEVGPGGRLVPARGGKDWKARRKMRGAPSSFAYDEGWGNLAFVGVVVHRSADKKVRQRARDLARELGLPYLGTAR
jgi:hypothetical protein